MRKSAAESRIPCLDGLRACSITAVLLAHLNGTRGLPSIGFLSWAGDLGNLGVRVFFVISGFLITHLLLEETKKRGKVSLKAFYVRRTFRIFPAFYAYVISIAALAAVGLVTVDPKDLVYAATYTINFIDKKSWLVGHIWSLAVEEQFYLLWPLTVVGLGWRRATRVALAVVLLGPFLRMGSYYLLPEYRENITKAFPTICDTIATGCLLACLRAQIYAWRPYKRLVGSPAVGLVFLVVLLSNALSSHTRPDLLIGQSIRNVGIAICIDWSLRNASSPVGRFLNTRPLVWVGTLSYSLYLWQQPFLNRASAALLCSFPLNLLGTFALAMVSYYAIEKPSLRTRARLFPGV